MENSIYKGIEEGTIREADTVFDKQYNNKWYHSTGFQMFICGVWWNEYEDEDGNVEYLN